MKIISYKPGHDGTVSYIADNQLIFSIEAEKDSHTRHGAITPDNFIDTLSYAQEVPDVVCISGWSKGRTVYNQSVGAGYEGLGHESILIEKRKLWGKEIYQFSSSHERSHLLCAFGLSQLPIGQPCYALVWEGALGTFYEIDEQLNIKRLQSVLNEPGHRYAFLYSLADPNFSSDNFFLSLSDAGKLMALASYSKRSTPTLTEEKICDLLLYKTPRLTPKIKDQLKDTPYYNVGHYDQEFRNFAGIYSDKIFDIFYQYASKNLNKKLPLLIVGGCGLNCDWNTAWRRSGIFSQVFVPPVPNDSGSAIGTAIDAQFYFTKNPKISWSVYAGLSFNYNTKASPSDFDVCDLSFFAVADLLANGLILAWVQDKYEIGPRALGNRSLLAAPFTEATTIRLNHIKQREEYRPIAPLCLEEDAKLHFNCQTESPYMLYFYHVNTTSLKAVTHVNNTARIQTVSSTSNKKMYELLSAFKAITGYGVLCNTSLNFKGTGFINSMDDLIRYTKEHGLDGFVAGDKCYLLNTSQLYRNYKAKKLGHSLSV